MTNLKKPLIQRNIRNIGRAIVMGALALCLRAHAAPSVNAVRETDNVTLNDQGDETYTGRLQFPTEAVYSSIKEAFPNPYVLMRYVLGSSGVMDVSDATVAYDDSNRSIRLGATVHGAACNKKNRWQIKTAKDAELLFTDNHKCVLSSVQPMSGTAMLLIDDQILELPSGAGNVTNDPKAGRLSFSLDRAPKTGACSLDVDLRAKPRIMSALYKIYGNDDFAGGIYWAGKAIFHNTGAGDLTNLKISYRLGEYSDWSPESDYTLLAAGGYVVDLYYPLFKSEVAQLESATPVDLEVKYSYTDSSGNTVSDTTSKRVSLLGANQFEYSNLTDEERTGTWADSFCGSPLVSAFVTKMDEPVRQFGGMVAQACGGQPAGYSDAAAYAFCKALYQLESANGIAYQSPVGFLSDYNDAGQELKYPRDVLRDKSGTCIELAMLYAAVCENAGLKCDIQMIPGHAFPVVELPVSGNYLPVESTGLSGAAVGQQNAMDFDAAVKMATDEWSKRQQGLNILIDVENMQNQGVLCPELPAMPADVIHTWGYKLPESGSEQTTPADQNSQTAQTAEAAQPEGGGDESVPHGFVRWTGVDGLVSVAFPSYWARLEKTPVAGLILLAGDMRSSVFVNVFHYPELQTASDGMDAVQQSVEAANLGRVHVGTTQQKGEATIYTGTTRAENGTNIWVAALRPTTNGVVGMFFGARGQSAFNRNRELIQTVIKHSHLGPEE